MGKLVTTEMFIEKAKKVHNNKYDYSKVEYISAHQKINIICLIHGGFWQTPNSHLNGRGCPICGAISCGKSKSSNTNEFIEKAKKVHNNKYDYSKVEYINNSTKVCIICPIHGEFWQTPANHLRGEGCVRCSRPVKDTKTFIERAQEVHGDKYDYSKVEYTKWNNKVCIICLEHGEFWQTPNSHLMGSGCPKCKGRRISEKKYKTNEYFIEKARKVHSNKYDYSKVGTIRASKKVTIVCPIHGEFLQKFDNHLMGNGCPKCNDSHLERDVATLLDSNGIKYEKQKKFKWLKNETTKMPLSLDFYLPEYNIAIECQGGQHFTTVDMFGGEKTFQLTVERDLLKLRLCRENGIKLIHYVDESVRKFKEWKLYGVTNGKDKLLNEIKEKVQLN